MNRMTKTPACCRHFAIVAALASLTSCTINPVTGERELALVSPQDEITIGEQQYFPSQQMQGGEYVLDPMLEAYVAGVGRKLAAVSDRDLPYEFVVLDNGVPNAWALPGGKIAVNRGLLTELDSEAELAAVLGHEIVHAAARHGALAMQRGLLLQGAVLAAAAVTQRSSGLAVGAASLGAQLVTQRNSRGAELEADLYGMRYMSRAGYDPRAAVTLQETFVRLSQSQPDGGRLAALFASHPPSEERVAKNRATAASLPAGGELGEQRYRTATAALRARQPAYDAYDKARAALAEKRLADAEKLGREAVGKLPAEAQFHALLGDIALAANRDADAVMHYADALNRNDRFFYYHLQKGSAHRALEQWDAAAAELQASIDLLPTAEAFFGLGAIAEHRGDRATALEQYARAAQSTGAIGQAAGDAIVRLDLPQNPGKYLSAAARLDADRRLVVDIVNPTRVSTMDVTVTVRYTDADGSAHELSRKFAGPLAPGGTASWSSGLGPFDQPDAFRVSIASAKTGG